MQALLPRIALVIVAAAGYALAAQDLTETFTTQEGYDMKVAFHEGEGFILRMGYTQFLVKYQQKPNARQQILLARNHARLILEQEVKRIAARQVAEQDGLIRGILAQPHGDYMEVLLKDVRVNGNPLSLEALCAHTGTCAVE